MSINLDSKVKNNMLKVKFLTLGQRHFPDFSRKENSKSSQIQMFPDFSRLFQSVTNPDMPLNHDFAPTSK